MLTKLGLSLGLLSLLHAAFSAAQYRSYLRVTEQPFVNLPLDIIVQALASLLIVLYLTVSIAGNFKVISADEMLAAKRQDVLFATSQPSFQVFDHRGRVLSALRNAGQ